MSTVQQPPITASEFERMLDPTDGSKLELVRGEVIVVPPPKGKHGIVCSQIAWLLLNFVKPSKLGWVTTNDTGVVLERGPDTVRGPDVAFWSIKQTAAANARRLLRDSAGYCCGSVIAK